jgi:hypothetical protein
MTIVVRLFPKTCRRTALYLVIALASVTCIPRSALGQRYDVAYNFCSSSNCTDGGVPESGVIRDAQGNLYGTTTYGGHRDTTTLGQNGYGVLFKIDSSGAEWPTRSVVPGRLLV